MCVRDGDHNERANGLIGKGGEEKEGQEMVSGSKPTVEENRRESTRMVCPDSELCHEGRDGKRDGAEGTLQEDC